jgi:hypothetical protein
MCISAHAFTPTHTVAAAALTAGQGCLLTGVLATSGQLGGPTLVKSALGLQYRTPLSRCLSGLKVTDGE